MKKVFAIPILVSIVYLLTSLVVPPLLRGEMIFLADAALWATVIVATIFLAKTYSTSMWRINKTILRHSAIIAAFHIFLAVFLAFFMGFGRNTNIWTPLTLAIYFPYLIVPFLAVELSRAYLAQKTTRKRPTAQLFLISLFFTLMSTTISGYTNLTTPILIAEFLIKTFIPILAMGLLATYLAFLGGFTASFTYMAIPTFFTWFSPILPNPPWAAQSIISVIATIVGFLLIDQTAKPLLERQVHRTLKKQKSQIPYWTAIALIGITAIWSSTGLLGFTPTIIASESMTPTLNTGDIAFIISAPPSTMKVGDIIQYRAASGPITHRVIDAYTSGNVLWFVTKGDANDAPDDPVDGSQVIGKLVFTIPQLGWVSIALKEFAANTYTFFTATVPQTLTNGVSFVITNGVYITSALAFTAYSYLLLTYKNHHKRRNKT